MNPTGEADKCTMSGAVDGFFFGSAEEAIEEAGREERRVALDDGRLGGRRVAGHFAEFHGGGAEILRARHQGTAFLGARGARGAIPGAVARETTRARGAEA